MKSKFVLCSKRIRSLPTDNVNSRVGNPEVRAEQRVVQEG